MSTKPARLYKYEPFSTQTLKNLKNQVIYFGAPANFNDPYDCTITPTVLLPDDQELAQIEGALERDMAPAVLATKDAVDPEQLRRSIHEVATRDFQNHLRNGLRNYGVSCFSETPTNLLMWSHYADRGRGVCLEFDTSFEPLTLARAVKYVECLPSLRVSELLGLSGEPDARVVDILFMKSRAWEYEREWRVLHQHAGTAFGYLAEALTGIYFGPETDFVTAEIVCQILRGQNAHVRFYSGSRSPTEFKVNFAPFDYTSFLEAEAKGLKRVGDTSQAWPLPPEM